MTPPTCECGEAATERLAVSYRYPRAEWLPEAVDPHNVNGSTSISTCGSAPCEAGAMLAAIDEIITNTAVSHGRLLNPEDVKILRVDRGYASGIGILGDGEAS